MPAPDYGVFIWSAYGVTGLVVAALLLRAVLDYRAQLKALARLENASPAAPPADRPSHG